MQVVLQNKRTENASLGTGNQVLFCNLAADPALFEGPKNDVQVGS